MVGTTLSHYRIVAELGRGGMGIVYRAKDTKLERTVAIKVLPAAALAQADDRARFYREARAAAALTHPNIAVIHEIDEAVPSDAPHGTEASPFIAMEFIEGDTLEDRIKKGPLKLKEAVRIGSEVAAGLKAAHTKDIVHRDIKSANIMLTEDGQAKILDFGLAQTAQSTKLTRLGSTLGTVAYMSPEQARGEEVDARTDIWALGVTLYEMISGVNPFGGDYEQAVVYSILNTDPEPLTALRTGVPMELERIVNKCCTKDASRRYQSSADLIADLGGVEITSSSTTRFSTITPPTAPGQEAGHAKWLAPASFLLGMLVVALGIVVWPEKEAPPKTVKRLQVSFEYAGSDHPVTIAISPDGSRMGIFTGSDTIIKNLQTGAEWLVGEQGYVAMFFSEDGEYVLLSGSSGKILKARSDGTERIELDIYDDDAVFAAALWGPDGEVISSEVGETIVIIPEIGPTDSLSSLGGGFTMPYQLLSDGRLLTVESDGQDEVVVVHDLETGNAQRMHSPGRIHTVAESGHILYGDDNFNVFTYPFDPESFEPIGPIVPLSFLNGGVFALASDGTLIYHTPDPDAGNSELRKIASDGQDELIFDGLSDSEFALSPDESSVVLRTEDASGNERMSVLDLRTGLLMPIANGEILDTILWNGRGDKIFGSWNNQGLASVATNRSENPVILVEMLGPIIGQMDWLSDGSRLAFSMIPADVSSLASGVASYDTLSDSLSWLVEPSGYGSCGDVSRRQVCVLCSASRGRNNSANDSRN